MSEGESEEGGMMKDIGLFCSVCGTDKDIVREHRKHEESEAKFHKDGSWEWVTLGIIRWGLCRKCYIERFSEELLKEDWDKAMEEKVRKAV